MPRGAIYSLQYARGMHSLQYARGAIYSLQYARGAIYSLQYARGMYSLQWHVYVDCFARTMLYMCIEYHI